MTYSSPQALRMALEQRLLNQSRESGLSLDRLRRRVIVERIVARLHVADPGRWVLKGGMALEVRLLDAARLTLDVDLGLRAIIAERDDLQGRLVDALSLDPFGDWFVFTAGVATQLMEDAGGQVTWRSRVAAHLAGKAFGGVQLDVSPRAHELDQSDLVSMPNSLAFAGIDSTAIEIIDVHRHAAEKYHAMFRDFGERENTRVRDLADLVILWEHELLDSTKLAGAVAKVWRERNGVPPPMAFPGVPDSWPARYEQLALDHGLTTTSFAVAVATVQGLWADMFPNEET